MTSSSWVPGVVGGLHGGFAWPAGDPRAERTHQLEGKVSVQGGRKKANYKHSGCEIQAVRLQYSKLQCYMDYKATNIQLTRTTRITTL